jgi:hypothetical protein
MSDQLVTAVVVFPSVTEEEVYQKQMEKSDVRYLKDYIKQYFYAYAENIYFQVESHMHSGGEHQLDPTLDLEYLEDLLEESKETDLSRDFVIEKIIESCFCSVHTLET